MSSLPRLRTNQVTICLACESGRLGLVMQLWFSFSVTLLLRSLTPASYSSQNEAFSIFDKMLYNALLVQDVHSPCLDKEDCTNAPLLVTQEPVPQWPVPARSHHPLVPVGNFHLQVTCKVNILMCEITPEHNLLTFYILFSLPGSSPCCSSPGCDGCLCTQNSPMSKFT